MSDTRARVSLGSFVWGFVRVSGGGAAICEPSHSPHKSGLRHQDTRTIPETKKPARRLVRHPDTELSFCGRNSMCWISLMKHFPQKANLRQVIQTSVTSFVNEFEKAMVSIPGVKTYAIIT